MRIYVFTFLFTYLAGLQIQAQIPELGISKHLADSCTIQFDNPQPGQFVRFYPKRFLKDSTSGFISDVFFDSVYLIVDALPGCSFEIAAHSTTGGNLNRQFNASQKRAASFAAYMVRFCGIEKSRFTNKGYGGNRPLYPCTDQQPCTEEQNEKNQRIELVILQVNQPDVLRKGVD